MNRSVAVILTAIMLLAFHTTAQAKPAATASTGEFEIDGSFSFATGPDSFDTGFGLNFGAGYMLGTIAKNLQGRIDISFYNFKYDYWWGGGSASLSYTRVPITVSGRYYFPIREKLRAFAQAGLETSIDKFDYYAGGRKQSKSEVNLGLTPGGGIEFFVNKDISIFAVARAHLIEDSYFSMHFGVASNF